MTASAADIVRELIVRMSQLRHDEALELYADDVVVHVKFALPAPVTVYGKDALRQRIRQMDRRLYHEVRVENLAIRETADGAVASWTYAGVSPVDGTHFRTDNIIVVIVKDGLIVESHDYHNHFERIRAMGDLPKLMQAFRSPEDAGQ